MRPIVLSDKLTNFAKSCTDNIAGPQTRFIMGITALSTQPFIDYYNSSVDEKTRKFSTCRTVAKIIAGTTVGVIVRMLTIKYSGKLLGHVDVSRIASETLNDPTNRKKLQNTIGDLLGVGVCLITNFLLDVPLTKMGTNYLAKKFNVNNVNNDNKDKKKERTK